MPPKRFDPFEIGRNDPPDLRRKKKKASEQLGVTIMLMENDGFRTQWKKSVIIFECPECKLVKILRPVMKSYEDGDWEFFPDRAVRDHARKRCSRANY